jgi:hypothetical protein
MTTVVITPKQYEMYMARLGKEYMPTIRKGILSGAMRSIGIVQRKTRDAGAVNTGSYLQKWRAERTENGALVSNDAPYSGVIENGRRPGTMPPSKAIALWAQRKLGLDAQEAKKASFMIARAIARRGLKARNVLSSAVPEITESVLAEVDREMEASLRKVS